MMSYDEWLNCIANAAQHIASKQYQEEAWFPGGKVRSSPEEAYLSLIEDCTPDLFFETYRTSFTGSQLQHWSDFRSALQHYCDKMPRRPDPRSVLDDRDGNSVRRSAQGFVRALRTPV
jgi:hypothetical protein